MFISQPATLEKKTQAVTPPAALQRRRWVVLAQGLTTAVFVILSLEALFAAAGLGEQEFLKRDGELGFVPMEGKHVTWRKEGFSRTQFNSCGMSDREYSLDKPAGTFRIAVIGDSMVESLQVDRSQSFCRLVEQELNKGNPERKFQVMNFGVSSYNLGQIYLRLQKLVTKFHVDLVLLCVRHNSVFDVFPRTPASFFFARPYFFLGNNGRLIQDYTVQRLWDKSGEARRLRACQWLREHSRTWGVVSSFMESAAAWYLQLSSNGLKWGADVTDKQTAFAPASKEEVRPLSGGQASPALANLPSNRRIAGGGTADTVASSCHDCPQQDDGLLAGKNSTGNAGAGEARAAAYYWPIAEALVCGMNETSQAGNSQLAILRLPTDYKPNNPETELLRRTASLHHIPFIDASGSFEKAKALGLVRLFYIKHFTPAGHILLTSQLTPYLASLPRIKEFCQSSARTEAPPWGTHRHE